MKNISNQIELIVAKSGDFDRWLPLWVHAEDTAGVIRNLIRTRYQSLSEVCNMEYSVFKKTAVLLAYLHDIGKSTPLFQSEILKAVPDSRRSELEHYVLDIPYVFDHKTKHSICGEVILLSIGFPRDFSSIVGAHHGMPADGKVDKWDDYPYPEQLFGIPKKNESYEEKEDREELWRNLYNRWCDFALERAGFDGINEIPALNKRTQTLLSGLIVMADWIASDQTKFELFDEDDEQKNFRFGSYPKDRLNTGIDRLNLPDIWKPQQENIFDDDFEARFSFTANDIQRAFIETVGSCEKPGIFILEAPMGIGKTEAALSAAEILAAMCEKNGVFFGLPTQATANGIFERFVPWVSFLSESQMPEQLYFTSPENFFGLSVNLSHGNASFSPIFESIKNNNVQISDDENKSTGVTVHTFFTGSKQSLLSDFVVGTVDRLLMAALKKKHAMLLHLGLSEKVVIVDECHAYDAYMNKYLDRALMWLHEYNVPVILLSATLPNDRRRKLVEAYLKSKNNSLSLAETSYPRLTYTDGDSVNTVSLPLNVPNKEVKIIRADDDCVEKEIRRAVNKGACVGIICNTVLRAQKFAAIAGKCDGANVIMYHAQFIIPDRADKEADLKRAVGKNSAQERRGTIVVGTQVLEQSLDIDFDILISDLCPMDLLLQRIGRLHRHKRLRPKGYETASCVVLNARELDKASEKIYTQWLLLRTNKLLPDSVNIPSDIDRLVSETYKQIEPEGEAESAAYNEYETLIKDKEIKASGFLMEKPKDSKLFNTLHGWLSNGVGDSEKKGEAAVRDGISSIEVIVLVRHSEGFLGFLPWRSKGERFSPKECPSDEECKIIAQQKLRLPSAFCQIYNIDQTISELEKMDKDLTGFQHSHWLKGELVLILDENLSANLMDFKLTFSQSEGLSYKKEDEI